MMADGEFTPEELASALMALPWQPIGTYVASDDEVLLRSGEDVKLGRGLDGAWLQAFDGELVEAEEFEPDERAVPTEDLELARRR